jgi:hypothetical protein
MLTCQSYCRSRPISSLQRVPATSSGDTILFFATKKERYDPTMARIAKVGAPGLPHHVTEQGNRRQQTFFCDDDYRAYLELMAQWCSRCAVEIWAYCLMPNHVHLIAVPESGDGLRSAIGGTQCVGEMRNPRLLPNAL